MIELKFFTDKDGKVKPVNDAESTKNTEKIQSNISLKDDFMSESGKALSEETKDSKKDSLAKSVWTYNLTKKGKNKVYPPKPDIKGYK